jgi:4-amino-4-deoxy-L-arabinose transferase-like glycosyltransferase
LNILLILAGSFFLLLAIRTYLKNQISVSLLLLLLAGLCFRIVVSLDPYLHPWDEQYHALVAKNLLQHPFIPTLYETPLLPFDYKDWTNCNIWLHKPPLTLWLIALSLRVFGVNEFSVRIPSIIFSSLSILITYGIAKNLFNGNVGWLAAFFVAINGRLIEMAGGRFATDHPDVCFAFFVELAIFFAVRQRVKGKWMYLIPTAIATACAIYCKWLIGLIVIPVWFILLFKRFPLRSIIIQMLVFLSIILILVLPWQIYIYHSFPTEASWESNFNWQHITTVLENHSGTWYFYLSEATQSINEFIWVAFVIFLLSWFKRKFSPEFTAILLWMAIPYLFFSCIKTKMPNYVMFCIPAAVIMISFFWWEISVGGAAKKTIKILRSLCLVLVILLSVRYTMDRLRIFRSNPDANRMEETAEVKRLLSQNWNRTPVFFNTPY